MNPTRRSILKWSGLALASSPVVGLLTLSISGPSLLERQRAAARREGIPLTPEDLRPNPPIPDSQNAGPLLKELTKRYRTLPEKERIAWEKLSGDLLKAPEDEALRATFLDSEQRYATLIHLAQDASALPHCDMAYDWSQGPDLLFPEFAVLRQFARILTAKAYLASDATHAWTSIAQAAQLGNRIGETPCLIAALVSVAIHAIADKGYIATLKRFGPSQQAHATLAAFGAPPDPELYFGGEVILSTVAMKQMRQGRVQNFSDESETPDTNRTLALVAPVATPYWEKQLLLFWRGAFVQARKCKQTGDYEALGKWFDATVGEWQKDKLNIPQNLMVLILTPVFSEAAVKTHLHTAALRHLRETALALLEEKAKTGSFPDSPTLPADPFAPDKQPLRYRKDGTGCLLYSIGQDHTDDGGVAKREKNSEKLDLVVRL
jgi:hypothetical protein